MNNRLIPYLGHLAIITIWLIFIPDFLHVDSSSYMPYLCSVVRLAMLWLCCYWHLLILSLVWEDFSLVMFWLSLIFAPYLFMDSPFITFVMSWIASPMDSVDSSTWTPLGIESTFLRVLFTHFSPYFIRWVFRLILMFSSALFSITSFIALNIILPYWRSSIQNYR